MMTADTMDAAREGEGKNENIKKHKKLSEPEEQEKVSGPKAAARAADYRRAIFISNFTAAV